jgi:hypothetical protein
MPHLKPTPVEISALRYQDGGRVHGDDSVVTPFGDLAEIRTASVQRRNGKDALVLSVRVVGGDPDRRREILADGVGIRLATAEEV